MILLDSFPIRPSHQYGESLAGYVYRAHSLNGHAIPADTSTLIGNIYGQGIAALDPCTWEKIEALLGRRARVSACDWSAAWRGLWRTHISSIRVTRLRWPQLVLCPKCVAEKGIHFALWEMPLIRACPFHRCRLVNSCRRCGSKYEWPYLHPDWHCHCGAVVTDGPLEPAGVMEYKQASTICLASDLPLPQSRDESVKQPDGWPSLPYATVIESLYVLHGLRRLIVDSLMRNMPPSLSHSDRRTSKARPEPHRWEYDLLSKWPRNLEDGLIRLVRWACRNDGRTLILIEDNSAIWHGIQYVRAAASTSLADSTIDQVVLRLIDSVRAPFPAHTLVIFNPKLGDSQKTGRIKALLLWWQALSRGYVASDPAAVSEMTGYVTAYPDGREARAIDLLNELFRIAAEGIEPQRCHLIFRAWIASCPEFEHTDPDAFLRQLWSTLVKTPSTVLDRMIAAATQIHGD